MVGGEGGGRWFWLVDRVSRRAAEEQRRQVPLWAACGSPMPACSTPRAALNARLHPQTQESERWGKALRARPRGPGQGRRGHAKGVRIQTARGRPGTACRRERQRPSPEGCKHTHARTHTHTRAHTHAHTHARTYARTRTHTHSRTRTHARTKQQKPLLLGQPQTPAFFALRGSPREAAWMGAGVEGSGA